MSKSIEQTIPPTLTDLLNAVKRNLSTDLNCVQIGIIQEFDIATQSAGVMLALKRVTSIAADGTRTMQERPILLQVPCMVLFGGNSFLSMPIAAGDNCIVLFNDREIDQWFAKGGVQTPVTYRAHSVSDAIAIVGIRSLQDSISDYLADGVRLSYSANSRISLTDNQIESIAALFKQNGDMLITGNLVVNGDSEIKGNETIDQNLHVKGGMQVDGIVTGTGGGGTITVNANVTLGSGKTVTAPTVVGSVVTSGNGATGSFANVTVLNGIVTGGS